MNMKKTAGFMKFCFTLALVLEVLTAIVLVIATIALLMMGSFSSLAEMTNSPITIDGGTMTPAEMDALKPVLLAALGFSVAALILTIIGTIKTRQALNEVKEERPFSEKCVKALKASARMEVLGGIVGIISSVVMMMMASSLSVNGSPIGKTTSSASFTFLFYAVQKYLLYHVAQYGHSLETNRNRM